MRCPMPPLAIAIQRFAERANLSTIMLFVYAFCILWNETRFLKCTPVLASVA